MNVINVSSSPDCGPIGSSVGAEFTSFTVTVMVSESAMFGVPSSVTTR